MSQVPGFSADRTNLPASERIGKALRTAARLETGIRETALRLP